MSLQFRNVDQAINDAVQQMDPRSAAQVMDLQAGGGGLSASTATCPTPLYSLSLDDLSAGAFPTSTGQVRYLVVEHNLTVGTATVAKVDEAGYRVHTLGGAGPLTSSFERAFEALEDATQDRSTDFELRALSIPALYVNALWAFSVSESFVCLLDPVFPPFVAESVYGFEEFLAVAREAAVEKVASMPRPSA